MKFLKRLFHWWIFKRYKTSDGIMDGEKIMKENEKARTRLQVPFLKYFWKIYYFIDYHTFTKYWNQML